MKTIILKSLAIVLLSSHLLLSSLEAADSGQAEPPSQPTEPSIGEEFGWGLGAAVASLFYAPAKVTYAGLGLITSGLGFVLSGGNSEVAASIMDPAVRGNYVVTPRHLKGEEPLIFVGPIHTTESQPPEQARKP
ncbi:MAG: hypothetical protein HY695_13880 [Deltaproteobacteria bacterium]|nr:hypothetical protein [Deltaproteobacteria bacterium]